MNTYAIIKATIPQDKLEIVRKNLEYRSGGTMTLQEFLAIAVNGLKTSFGPECQTSVQEIGVEEI